MQDIIGSVVVYRNHPEQIRKAITSFLNTNLNVRLYVIDNSPDDQVRELCGDRRVTYIFNRRNLGFGAGHNVAMKTSLTEAKYHVVLNPDVHFGPGVIEKLLDFSTSRPEIALLIPNALNAPAPLHPLPHTSPP